jgi:hypothetical protein
MRTTLSIDDDVLLAVKERAVREKRTAGDVLSELARQALTGPVPASRDAADARHGFSPLPHRGRPVSNSVIDELLEQDDG